MPRTVWVRVRNQLGHEFDRPADDPRIASGVLEPVRDYPAAHKPRPPKHRTDKAGRPVKARATKGKPTRPATPHLPDRASAPSPEE